MSEVEELRAEVERLRGPFRCCEHCKDDVVHDVEPNQHEVSCQLCDDRLTRRAESAERARDAALAEVTELRDRLGRVEELADNHQQPGAWIAQPDGSHKWMTQLRAALNGYRIVWRPLPEGYVLEPLAALAVPVTVDTEDASPAAEDALDPCGRKVGSKTWWMSSDQYDPCRCLLPKGHYGECKCSHTLEDTGAASPTEQATEGGAK